MEAEKGGVKQRHAVEGVLGSTALAAGSEKMMWGISVEGWVNELLGFVHLGLGRVLVGLLEGLLKGLVDIPISKRIRALLKTLNGSEGLGVRPSFMTFSAGLANGFHKIGFGFPLKPNRVTQPSRRVWPLFVSRLLRGWHLRFIWECPMLCHLWDCSRGCMVDGL
jgi:hypothetical protein